MNSSAPAGPRRNRKTGLWLCAAPAVLLVSRTLTTPISNEPADFVLDVQAAAAQTEAGAALGILGALMLIPTLALLAQSARRGRRRLGLVAGVLTSTGCIGLVLVAAMQAIGARLSVQPLPPAQLSDLFDQIYNEGTLPAVAQLAIVCGAIGSVCLGIALSRSPNVSRLSAATAGIGTLLLFVTAPGPLQPLLMAAALVAAGGYAAVGIGAGATPRPGATAAASAAAR